MKKIFLVLWLWCVSIHGIETDFDCIVVGTSPFSLFEAVYRGSSGSRVLVVEQASECGGAWKSITICGIPGADLGCHEFGHDPVLKTFLEEYAGCKIVPNAPPQNRSLEGGEFYPSRGCYELTRNLQRLMDASSVSLLLNSKVETVFIDTDREIAEVKIEGVRYTTRKLVITHNSNLIIENLQAQGVNPSPSIAYPHIYLLIADPTPPRFTYRNLSGQGASRAMNLTPFIIGLENSGKQLIAIQLYTEQNLGSAEKHFEELKKLGLLDSSAQILYVESYIYRQVPFNQAQLQKLGSAAPTVIEVINTGHISNLRNSIDKWKMSMKPWNEVMGIQACN